MQTTIAKTISVHGCLSQQLSQLSQRTSVHEWTVVMIQTPGYYVLWVTGMFWVSMINIRINQ